MTYKIENFEEIIKNKITLSRWAEKNNSTKQNISVILKKLLNEYTKNSEYIKFQSQIEIDKIKNEILRIDQISENKFLIDVFSYINKSNIFRFNDKIFYSVKVKKIEIDSEIKKFKNKKDVDNLSEILLNLGIKTNKEFIELYLKSFKKSKSSKTISLDIAVEILKNINKPISKIDFIKKALIKGIGEKTAINIIKNHSNSGDIIVNLGETICLRDIFFNKYLDREYASRFKYAAIDVCKKSNISTTDIKWIKNSIEKYFLKLDTSKYSLFELKAILCNEPQFKTGVKYNIDFIDISTGYMPLNINEYVENILEEYEMPISLTFLMQKLEEKGKNFSRTTLASHTLPNSEIFEKIDRAGWILKRNEEKVKAVIKKVEDMGLEIFFEQLKKDYEALNLKELAEKMGLRLSTVYETYCGKANVAFFFTRLTENSYKISILEDKLNIKKLNK